MYTADFVRFLLIVGLLILPTEKIKSPERERGSPIPVGSFVHTDWANAQWSFIYLCHHYLSPAGLCLPSCFQGRRDRGGERESWIFREESFLGFVVGRLYKPLKSPPLLLSLWVIWWIYGSNTPRPTCPFCFFQISIVFVSCVVQLLTGKELFL